MSYILDALKKADSERARERSAVPGLDAQPEAALGGEARRGGGAWRAVAIGSLALLGAALAWWGLGRDEPAPVVAGAPSATPTPIPTPTPAPTATPTAAPTPAPVAASPSTMPVQSANPPPAAAPPVAAAQAPPPARRETKPTAAVAQPKVPAPAAPPASEARLPTLAQLPADLRAALPPLSISGAVYAPQAGARMVFLNGQVLREGSEVAAGLTVERIGPNATVLSFRGTRFELRH